MFASRALRAKIVRTGPAAPPPPAAAPRPPRGLPSPAKPAQSRSSPALAEVPAQDDRAKSLFQSYMSIAPTARIVFGLALGAIGLAGLYWDRQYPESTPEDEQKLPISVRMVDRVK